MMAVQGAAGAVDSVDVVRTAVSAGAGSEDKAEPRHLRLLQ